MKKSTNAFTLIELLIVVSVIGILTAVLMTVINPRRAQGTARDGVRMANIEKLAQAIETYNAAEGEYPEVADLSGGASDHIPTTSDLAELPSQYISNWPEPHSAGFEYVYYLDGADGFVISVKSERGSNSCIKYGSAKGRVYQCKVCGDLTSASCTEEY